MLFSLRNSETSGQIANEAKILVQRWVTILEEKTLYLATSKERLEQLLCQTQNEETKTEIASIVTMLDRCTDIDWNILNHTKIGVVIFKLLFHEDNTIKQAANSFHKKWSHIDNNTPEAEKMKQRLIHASNVVNAAKKKVKRSKL